MRYKDAPPLRANTGSVRLTVPLINSTPYCTIDNKERLICGICGRPIGEKQWAEASSGGKGYDVDHVANLIFNELLGLNARSDGLGFLNTCAKCNQAFKSEKIWSPSIELWNVLNEICKTKRYIIDPYPWPGRNNTGLTEEIPFGGVRVYTIVNTYNNELRQRWRRNNILAQVTQGEGYYSDSARRNKTAEMEPHELELVILDRYLKIAETSMGQYMIGMENGFIKKYTEKVSIIASGANYIDYQTRLTDLLQNKIIRDQQEREMLSSQEVMKDVEMTPHPSGLGFNTHGLDRKSQLSLDIEVNKKILLMQNLNRSLRESPEDFVNGLTSAMALTGVPVPFNQVNVKSMTREDRMNFGDTILNAWRNETRNSNKRKSQEMIRNTIAEQFANRIDSTNLFLLLDELNREEKSLSNPSPPRPTSSEAKAQGPIEDSPMRDARHNLKFRKAKYDKIILRILDSIVMYKAMNNGRSSLIPQKYIKQSGRENTAVMDILTGNIYQIKNIRNSEVIRARNTATSQNSFPKAKKSGTGTTRRKASLFGSNNQDSAAASAAAASAAASAPAAPTAAPAAYGLRTPSPKKRGGSDTYGGGKGKTLKIRRRKKNTRRNRKNKNNKTKFKKRYKLKLTRRNK